MNKFACNMVKLGRRKRKKPANYNVGMFRWLKIYVYFIAHSNGGKLKAHELHNITQRHIILYNR